ncbi:uncharacterized protein LOC134264565 [Saccostrea cucullata]|uniref:uncharacterized protein LOC134264565 n=1 Tax=Saccostrea cuccullata TaxID=36930 RepID=UPI002ED32715
MRVREVREHGEEHEADITSVLGHNVQMHDAGQQDNSATGDFHTSQTTISSSQGTTVEEIEMSSQGSYVEIDNLDRLNRFLIDVDLEPFSFPHSLWQTYTAKTKKKYFKGMQNMLERVAEILFGGDKYIVMKEFHQEVGNPDHNPVTYLPAESDITEALIESYKKASSWQIRRQILSVLSVSKSYQDIKVLLPGTTEYRYLSFVILPPSSKFL